MQEWTGEATLGDAVTRILLQLPRVRWLVTTLGAQGTSLLAPRAAIPSFPDSALCLRTCCLSSASSSLQCLLRTMSPPNLLIARFFVCSRALPCRIFFQVSRTCSPLHGLLLSGAFSLRFPVACSARPASCFPSLRRLPLGGRRRQLSSRQQLSGGPLPGHHDRANDINDTAGRSVNNCRSG